MTVEELRAEAKKLGYNIIKIKEREKLLDCTCGSKRREHWYHAGGGCQLVCQKCGKTADGINDEDVRRNWNVMIRKELENATTTETV